MLRNNLIIAWRNLMRHRLHTVINLAGLGLGMAFCLLAWRFASQEWSFDRFHSKGDRIYRVYFEYMSQEKGVQRRADVIEFAFAPELEALAPHVERTVRLNAGDGNERKRRVVRMTFEGSSSEEEFLAVDPAFFEVFDFPLLLGGRLHGAGRAQLRRAELRDGSTLVWRRRPTGAELDDEGDEVGCRGLHHHRSSRAGSAHIVNSVQHAAAV